MEQAESKSFWWKISNKTALVIGNLLLQTHYQVKIHSIRTNMFLSGKTERVCFVLMRLMHANYVMVDMTWRIGEIFCLHYEVHRLTIVKSNKTIFLCACVHLCDCNIDFSPVSFPKAKPFSRDQRAYSSDVYQVWEPFFFLFALHSHCAVCLSVPFSFYMLYHNN